MRSKKPSKIPPNMKGNVVKKENVFKRFEEALVEENSGKIIKDWIEANKDVLNERFGKKHETVLHRWNKVIYY